MFLTVNIKKSELPIPLLRETLLTDLHFVMLYGHQKYLFDRDQSQTDPTLVLHLYH